jgi:2-polyprenyl-6-methoxyphenol hydroxylase-like FAD-dependent oxidoreductase
VTMYFFKQPTMEKHLRSVITDSLYSDVRVQSTVTGISEDEEWVYVNYSGADGETRHIKSRFLVGADGKTGFTRKMYLKPRGVVTEKTHK